MTWNMNFYEIISNVNEHAVVLEDRRLHLTDISENFQSLREILRDITTNFLIYMTKLQLWKLKIHYFSYLKLF